MKKNKGKVAISIFIMVIIIGILISIIYWLKYKKEDSQLQNENKKDSPITTMEDGTKINTRIKVNEAKEVNGLLITNIQLTEKDGLTTLLANVTNKTGNKTEYKRLRIVFLDENENEISSATAFIKPLEVDETTQLNASTTSNYINAYDIKIVETLHLLSKK